MASVSSCGVVGSHVDEEEEEEEEDATQLKFGAEFASGETKMLLMTEVLEILKASFEKKSNESINVPERFRKALEHAERFQVQRCVHIHSVHNALSLLGVLLVLRSEDCVVCDAINKKHAC